MKGQSKAQLVVSLDRVTAADVARVGGKNASLGEMAGRLRARGIRVPPGFATTAGAYWLFIDENRLREPMAAALARLRAGQATLAETGTRIRRLVRSGRLPDTLIEAVAGEYRRLRRGRSPRAVPLAVRSSATAEDLPSASFAGQHDSFLNVTGEADLLIAIKSCMVSLFNDRAIAYRERNAFEHMKVALSVGVQEMVRSDRGAAGVMFTLDPESGFPEVVRIEGAWGLGETVVQGRVDPDSFMVFKPLLGKPRTLPIIDRTLGRKTVKMVAGRHMDQPTRAVATTPKERRSLVLSDRDVLILARWAVQVERHYRRPMDIEWAKDGRSGRLYVVQARPETVQSQTAVDALTTYSLGKGGRRLVSGLAVGDRIAVGPVCKVRDPSEAARFPPGGILVAAATDPDWVPLMRKAAAIVTEHGGRTSHAAIVSREFGLPAVVGAARARTELKDGQTVTVSCAEGDIGHVYDGAVRFKVRRLDPSRVPTTRTEVMLNLANPAAAMRWWRLGAAGVGLARIEFIISNHIKIHPLALARFRQLSDPATRRQIDRLTEGDRDKAAYFVERLALGIARLAAAFHPRPVIVRLSDFKTNEYAALIGGSQFEPREENPMIGWRGASRYYSPDYRDGFALECRAIARVRQRVGLRNVLVMIPFCRTPEEADRVLSEMARHGLRRGKDGLEVYVMCEIPANVILADDFADRFDGFSIGSNDLTQLTLGIDRDSDRLAPLFKEDNPAVLESIRHVIRVARRRGRKIGLCGQAPSDHPAYARLLVEAGIHSISVSPDSFVNVKRQVAAAERRRPGRRRG